ncbi:hypothetical protein D039_1190B, partial [Vibrio parahaemolyticus EKP-028]
VIKRKQ